LKKRLFLAAVASHERRRVRAKVLDPMVTKPTLNLVQRVPVLLRDRGAGSTL